MVLKTFSTLETDFYKHTFEKNIEGQDIGTHKTFAVPWDNIKLIFQMSNDSVAQNEKKHSEG